MMSKRRAVVIRDSLAALIIGGLFFFDIIGVFGLGLAITGLVVFIVCSLAVCRFSALKGAPQ
jgi:hypothetical protein